MLSTLAALPAITIIWYGMAIAQLPQEVTDTIRGKIILEDGTPAAGIDVYPALPTDRETYRTRTSKTGTFTLRFRPTTFFFRPSIIAVSPDGKLLSYSPDSSRFVRMTLKPAHTITCQVHDSTGAPCESATVMAIEETSATSATCAVVAETTTDQNGRCRLIVPADAAIGRIFAMKKGIGCGSFANLADWMTVRTPPPPANVQIDFEEATTASVKVVDSDGRAISGVLIYPDRLSFARDAAVSLSGGRQTLGQKTNTEGIVSFDWFPANARRQPSVRIDDRTWCGEEDLLSPGSKTPHRMQVQGRSHVSGKVTRPDGTAVQGVVVQAQTGGTSVFGKTGKDGAYDVAVYPGQVAIGIADTKGASSISQLEVFQNDKDIVNLTYLPGTEIRGSIKNEDGSLPSLGTLVTLNGGGVSRRTGLADDGTYSFLVGPGEYRLQPFYSGRVFRVNVTNQPELVVDAQIPAELQFRHIVGKVLDPTGQPVKNARLNVTGKEVGFQRAGRAGRNGEFDFRQYDELLLMAADEQRNLVGLQVVPAGHTKPTVELTPGTTVSGTFTTKDGKPIANTVCSVSVQVPDFSHISIDTRTDETGKLQIRALPLGADLQFNFPNGAYYGRMVSIRKAGNIDIGKVTIAAPR